MAISSKDIEILWKRYSEEGSKRGISVTQYFESNGVPYHVFEKWYKKKFSQPAVVNCMVSGDPEAETDKHESPQEPKKKGEMRLICQYRLEQWYEDRTS